MGEREPLRLIQVGAGSMGRAWLRTIRDCDQVELVGLVDLDTEVATAAAVETGFDQVRVASGLPELIESVDAQAVVNVTIPAAHHRVTTQALLAGLPVLSEKPVAPTVAEGLSLAAAAEVAGQLVMISQSRRYFRHLTTYKRLIDQLSDIGTLACQFFKAPHFGGFREEMPHPLLVDMAIHPFDTARYLLDAEPVAVYCDAYNPSWSWYAGDAAASATFEFAGGARFVYQGSWCSPGLETSWNGDWRASSASGTALWNGDDAPTWETTEISDVPAADENELETIAGSLAEFVRALDSGTIPSGEVHSNVLSLTMVEAAVQSATMGSRVLISDVLAAAYETAVANEQDHEVAATLTAWNSVEEAVGLHR